MAALLRPSSTSSPLQRSLTSSRRRALTMISSLLSSSSTTRSPAAPCTSIRTAATRPRRRRCCATTWRSWWSTRSSRLSWRRLNRAWPRAGCCLRPPPAAGQMVPPRGRRRPLAAAAAALGARRKRCLRLRVPAWPRSTTPWRQSCGRSLEVGARPSSCHPRIMTPSTAPEDDYPTPAAPHPQPPASPTRTTPRGHPVLVATTPRPPLTTASWTLSTTSRPQMRSGSDM